MENTLYLLTGAAGNLGSNISRNLIAQKKRVRALVLLNDPASVRIPKEAEIIAGDIMDASALERFFAAPDGARLVVIHCASIVSLTPEYNQKVYDINVTGTCNIVKKCIERNAAKLVYISSTSAIPELPRGQVIREVDSFDPQKVIGSYAQTKAEATQIVLDAARERGLDASVVFPSGILGPNDYSFGLFSKFIMDYVHGRLPVGVSGSFNAVDVRDLADGVIACAEIGRKGEGYIIANETVTFRELLRLFHKHTGAREVRIIVPLPVARVFVFFAELYSKIIAKPGVFTAFTLYNLARNNDFSSEKAKRELGINVRPFEETIADTIQWLVSEKKITLQPALNSY